MPVPKRVYRNVCTYIWNDDKFPFASDDVQLVWFHLFTNPLSSPLGVFKASISGLAEEKNQNGLWTCKRYRDAISEAIRYGFLKHDPKAMLLAFPKYFSVDHTPNHPVSPNQLISWGRRFKDLPGSELKLECYQSLKAIVDGMADGMRDAFAHAFEQPSLMAYAIPDPNPNPNPEPNPNPNPKEKREIAKDTDWLAALRANPLYKHVNFDEELKKIERWKLIPGNQSRQVTKRFLLNWLNRIDIPIAISKQQKERIQL